MICLLIKKIYSDNDMFINQKRNMINWKYVYFIEIGYFIKS